MRAARAVDASMTFSDTKGKEVTMSLFEDSKECIWLAHFGMAGGFAVLKAQDCTRPLLVGKETDIV